MSYTDNRRRLLASLARERAAAVLFSGTPPVRNHDAHYAFRPHSDFWYLTGFGEEDCALVLLPEVDAAKSKGKPAANGAKSHEPPQRGAVLFLRERDPEMETWNGRRLGVENAVEKLGVDAAYPIDELWERLPQLLKNYERVMALTGVDTDSDRDLLDVLRTLRLQARRGVLPPTQLLDPMPLLHEQRLFKTPFELERMQKAADITREAHLELMRHAAPGVMEYELDALLDYTFRRRGGNGPAYNNIVAGGVNATILHYTENNTKLRDGDLLLVDAGCEYEYYACDVTRTYPVNGRFSREQRELYDVVLAAQLAGIDAVKPGAPVKGMHEVALRMLCEGLLKLGLLKGGVDEVIESGAYRRFYMHGTGHWLGLDVHDCGTYAKDGSDTRPFEPGMITTVEPGLYVAPDDDTVEARWRGIGIRIEDDALVTASGNRILTDGIPKHVDEVEAACAGRELSAAR